MHLCDGFQNGIGLIKKQVMKKMIMRFDVCAVLLVAIVFASGCKKYEEPYSSAKEASQIKTWVVTMVKNNFNVDSTLTGLYYITDKVGTIPLVHEGDTVTVKYTGMFLDKTIFDSSASYTYIHKANDQRMIPGWEEGIEHLGKGGSATLLVPSDQAYGPMGYSVIPPYTPLLFVIEVIDIK